MKKNLIKLGECRKPHGVKGAFSFHLYNRDSSILRKGSTLFLLPADSSSIVLKEGQEFSIQSISFGNKTICQLKEVSDRNLVESLIPFEIYIDRSFFPDLEEGEFYLSDLIGCKVQDNNKNELGVVESLGTNGVQDILNIRGKDENFEILLIDNFVKEIDLENLIITIDMPELI